jgi:hypothetical protein
MGAPASMDLLERLGHQIAGLMRREIEVALAERLPAARRSLGEVGLLGFLLAVSLLALGGLSWGAGALLSRVLPTWGAAFAVAGAWLTVGLVILRVLRRRLPSEAAYLGVVRMPGPALEAVLLQRSLNNRVRAQREVAETLQRVMESFAATAAGQGTEALGAAVKEGAGEVLSLTKQEMQSAAETASSDMARQGGRALRGLAGALSAPGRLAAGLALTGFGAGRRKGSHEA